jgi:hypothetical protein
VWNNTKTLPLGINYIGGKKRTTWEGGIGITPYSGGNTFTSSTGSGAIILLNIGDRFQPFHNRFLFRFTISSGYDTAEDDWVSGFLGLSVGYSFK